ncbi:MAG TPA: hypothetical protein VG838_10660 [Opitutaceae bacterium]|nr:hypothetical protein [Opitutaceae bacterium]
MQIFMAAAAAASSTTAMDRLKAVPAAFWLKLAIGIGIFIAAIIALRKVAAMNKVVLAVLIFIIVIVGGVNWIYERNEPAILTPLIDKIAPFFPSKGSYGGKQQGGPKV